MSRKLKMLDRSLALMLLLTPALGLGYGWIHNERIAMDERRSLEQSTGSGMIYEPKGNEACPCVSLEAYEGISNEPLLLSDDLDAWFGTSIDRKSYGHGCSPHDDATPSCTNFGGCSSFNANAFECDKSWCKRSWCYIDPNNCTRQFSPSSYYKNKHISYATCGFADSFTGDNRIASLKGETLNVAFNSNSGGWQGAYNPSGSFAIDDKWSGPIVSFIRESARLGEFRINVTEPPEWLRNESNNFFGGTSSFDYCVYAATLGYVDFCVSAYTMTNKRSSVGTFFETTSDQMYLITFNADKGTSWDNFVKAFKTIFQPFTWAAWAMIFCFAFPVLGLLMLFHEYGAPGSSYTKKRKVLVVFPSTGHQEVRYEKNPFWYNIPMSLYTSWLDFFGSYDHYVCHSEWQDTPS